MPTGNRGYTFLVISCKSHSSARIISCNFRGFLRIITCTCGFITLHCKYLCANPADGSLPVVWIQRFWKKSTPDKGLKAMRKDIVPFENFSSCDRVSSSQFMKLLALSSDNSTSDFRAAGMIQVTVAIYLSP